MRVLIAAGLMLAGLGQAFAADFPLPSGAAPNPPGSYYPIVEPLPDWGGFYVGLNGGYAFGSSNWNDPKNPGNKLIGGTTTPGVSTGDFNASGGLVGATFGLNMQASSFLFGVETDIDWSGIKGGTSPANGFCNLAVSASAVASTCETKNDWLGTARARMGYVTNRVLVYGTGGAAFGNVQTGLTGSGLARFSPATGPLLNNVQLGWTVGAGIEVAFFDRWTAKLEYLYVDLGTVTCNVQASCGIDAFGLTGFTPANDTIKSTANVVRFGVNYRFGPW
jgi:outer membrane immunogenic protein